MQLFPVTRKSMGGLAIDADTRVLNTHGKPVPGLFAVGEATGVAGINGNYGGEGTFLGPSVYTGRIAGRTVARSAVTADKAPASPSAAPPVPAPVQPGTDPAYRAQAVTIAPEALAILAGQERAGYRHFPPGVAPHRASARPGLRGLPHAGLADRPRRHACPAAGAAHGVQDLPLTKPARNIRG